MRRRFANKRKSAKAFNRGSRTTRRANKMIMRGGWRL